MKPFIKPSDNCLIRKWRRKRYLFYLQSRKNNASHESIIFWMICCVSIYGRLWKWKQLCVNVNTDRKYMSIFWWWNLQAASLTGPSKDVSLPVTTKMHIRLLHWHSESWQALPIERPIVCKRSLVRLTFEPNIVIYISIEAHMTCHLETWSWSMSDRNQLPCKGQKREHISGVCGSWQPCRNSSKLSFPALFQRQGLFYRLALIATGHIRFA